MIQNYNLQKRS